MKSVMVWITIAMEAQMKEIQEEDKPVKRKLLVSVLRDELNVSMVRRYARELSSLVKNFVMA